MSLKSSPIPPIPEVTARVAHAAFPHGNTVMQLRDALGSIYTAEAFADLFPTHGQPAEAPWRLALVTVFQCMEGLTDRQEASAVRDRLAWKYALSLELTDVGFDHTVLSECAFSTGQGRCRAAPVRPASGAMSGRWMAQGRRASKNGLDSCPG